METIIGTEITDDGLRLGHTWHEVGILSSYITRFSPAYFIEVGVHEGALSRYLMEHHPEVQYVGIEINCGIVRVNYHAGILICDDCFSEKVLSYIGSIRAKKFIYCDGGHKADELLVYAPLCNSGDILFCHDYNDGTRQGEGLPDTIQEEVFVSDLQKFRELNPDFIDYTQDADMDSTRFAGFVKK